MIYRCFLLFLLLLSLCSLLRGQSKADKVHLKDGSILVGEIIEDNEYYIRIALTTIDDTLKIGYKLIQTVGEPAPQRIYKAIKKPLTLKRTGIAFTIGFNLESFGPNNDPTLRPELLISKRMKNGKMNLGMALDYHSAPFSSSWVWQERQYYGIAAYARYYIMESKYRPFIDGSTGYSIAGRNQDWGNQTGTYEGGFTGSIGGGIYIPSRRKGNFILRGGVDFLQTSGYIENNDNWSGNGDVIIDYNEKIFSLFIGVAIEF